MDTEKTTELQDYKVLITNSIIETVTKLTELVIHADIPYKLRFEIDPEHPDVDKFIILHQSKTH